MVGFPNGQMVRNIPMKNSPVLGNPENMSIQELDG